MNTLESEERYATEGNVVEPPNFQFGIKRVRTSSVVQINSFA